MLWAFLAPATILAAGEYAQRYLPGRTAEITDLVLLAAGAILLHLTAADS
jgi:VanZ family protein